MITNTARDGQLFGCLDFIANPSLQFRVSVWVAEGSVATSCRLSSLRRTDKILTYGGLRCPTVLLFAAFNTVWQSPSSSKSIGVS